MAKILKKKQKAKSDKTPQVAPGPFSYCELNEAAPLAIASDVSGSRLAAIVMLANKWATEDDLKSIDKDVRDIVADAADFAQADPEPDVSELWTDILA